MSGARRSYGCAYRVSEQHPGPLLPLNARGKASHRGAAALNSATARPAAHRPANRARPSSLRGGAHFCCRVRRFDSTRQHACQPAPFGRAGGKLRPRPSVCMAAVRSGLGGSRRGDKAAVIAMFVIGLRGWAMGTAGFTGGCPAVKYWPCTLECRIWASQQVPKTSRKRQLPGYSWDLKFAEHPSAIRI